MVLVPGGEFTRGRSFKWSDYDVKWYPNPAKDDEPARRITVDGIYMDQAEVTNERYAAFVTATGHTPPYYWREGKMPEGKGRYPVADVSWDDASEFCAAEGKRLPTEAEWEHGARGKLEGAMYPWGDRTITSGDAVYNQLGGPQPVCGKSKNEWGLCDMIGNVWEWCSDWYGQHYYGGRTGPKPSGARQRTLSRAAGRLLVRCPAVVSDILISKLGEAAGAKPNDRFPMRPERHNPEVTGWSSAYRAYDHLEQLCRSRFRASSRRLPASSRTVIFVKHR